MEYLHPFEQLFLLSGSPSKRNAEELATLAWDIVKKQRQRILKEGKTLQTDDEKYGGTQKKAEAFLPRIPVLGTLGIA